MEQNLKHDFDGFATAYEVPCTDGRTIGTGAFDHQDGVRVPLVWRHLHDSMDNVVGHGYLVKHPKGMRLERAKFNKTKPGQQARMLVVDGDIDSLSVWANQIKEQGSRVVHGFIREVSLVLSGANPGAKIDTVIAHDLNSTVEGDDFEEGVIIHSGMSIELVSEKDDVEHEDERTVAEILEAMTEEQKGLVGFLVQSAITGAKFTGNTGESPDGPTVEDILASMSEEQKNVLYYMVGVASEDDAEAEIKQSDEEGKQMTQHNIFETKGEDVKVLSHNDQKSIIADAMKTKANSLHEVVVEHAGTYGLDNIDVLFPEAVNVNGNEPTLYGREQSWVPMVMNAIRKTPFSRIKSAYADISAAEARARGYITAAEKFEEVFPLFARTTTPQTIYKKQKLDRDDMLDITGFDVVMWLKKEMKLMLLEEIARAVLISDGRTNVDPDKINVANVRPIYTDDDLYAHKILFAQTDDVLDIIDGITAAREHYKGSGNPTLYLAPGILSSMLLVRGTTDERRLYETEASLKAALRVSNIVEVPLMAGVSRDGVTNVQNLVAILVNLNDYVIGADKGGETTFFDDFDIDFNQYKYLYETRISGALVRPKSAIVFEQDTGTPI